MKSQDTMIFDLTTGLIQGKVTTTSEDCWLHDVIPLDNLVLWSFYFCVKNNIPIRKESKVYAWEKSNLRYYPKHQA